MQGKALVGTKRYPSQTQHDPPIPQQWCNNIPQEQCNSKVRTRQEVSSGGMHNPLPIRCSFFARPNITQTAAIRSVRSNWAWIMANNSWGSHIRYAPLHIIPQAQKDHNNWLGLPPKLEKLEVRMGRLNYLGVTRGSKHLPCTRFFWFLLDEPNSQEL